MEFCPKCGTLCIHDIKEQDFLRLSEGKTVTVKSLYKDSYGEYGDNPYTKTLMEYSRAGFFKHNFIMHRANDMDDEFTLNHKIKDPILNRIAWSDKKNHCPICGNKKFSVLINNPKTLEKLERIDIGERYFLTDGSDSSARYGTPAEVNKIYEKDIDPLVCEAEVSAYIKDCETRYVDNPLGKTDKNKINEVEYINQLIELEMSIRYSAELLYKLLISQKKTGRLACYEKCGLPKKIEVDLRRNELKQSQLEEQFKTDSTKSADELFNLKKPQKKTIRKLTIDPPQYRKPNIFNKTKVLAENEHLKRQYLAKIKTLNDEYEKAVKESEEKYNFEMGQYNKQIAELQEEYYARYTEEKDHLLKKQKRLESARERFSDNLDDHLSNTQNQQINNALIKDIEDVKATLQKLYDTKHQLESAGIIYPKYLNFVALTMMSEYLSTGRCTELTGADGAYNLYESEIRANRVIAQLDQVVDSLEQIKDNQYKTYSFLTEINRNMSYISDKINDAVNTLSIMQYDVGYIRDNSRMTAYNTAMAAYYAKTNTQLTNSLGYLIALK